VGDDRAFVDFVERLRDEYPTVMQMAEVSAAPVVRVDCPRGHTITHLRLEVDHNDWPVLMFVSPSGDYLSHRAHPRAVSGRPAWASEVCVVSGCPNIRPCSDHDVVDRDIPVDVASTRTRLRCPRCTYDGVHTQTMLLGEYVAAAALWERVAEVVDVQPTITLRV
jgi:hypothetical protein